ncbi:hypothetical protein D9M73_185350 [compost metagenome]
MIRLLAPYLPTVKAIAPNAPTGAARIRMPTMRNTISATRSIRSSTGSAGSPTSVTAMPNNTATNSVCRIDPSVSADTIVLGMIDIRKPTKVVSCACLA